MTKKKDNKITKARNIPIKVRIDENLYLDAIDVIKEKNSHSSFTEFLSDAIKNYINKNK